MELKLYVENMKSLALSVAFPLSFALPLFFVLPLPLSFALPLPLSLVPPPSPLPQPVCLYLAECIFVLLFMHYCCEAATWTELVDISCAENDQDTQRILSTPLHFSVRKK